MLQKQARARPLFVFEIEALCNKFIQFSFFQIAKRRMPLNVAERVRRALSQVPAGGLCPLQRLRYNERVLTATAVAAAVGAGGGRLRAWEST